MYYLAKELGIPNSSVRVTLSRMCKDGSVLVLKDECGETRYKMGKMLTLISEQAALFGRGEGFTIAIFNFKTDEEKQRYRVREILRSFGFKKFAQNTYIALKVNSKSIGRELAQWGLQDNVFLFDCTDAGETSVKARISSLWHLEEWEERLTAFYNKMKIYLDFTDIDDETRYKRYSIAYSIFFSYFYEKHPSIPLDYFPEGYPLGEIFELFEKIVQTYGAQISGYYCCLNQIQERNHSK